MFCFIFCSLFHDTVYYLKSWPDLTFSILSALHKQLSTSVFKLVFYDFYLHVVLTKLLVPLSLSAPPSGARCGSAVQVTHGLQLLGACLYYLKKIVYSNTLNYIVLKTGHSVFPISKIIICCKPQKPCSSQCSTAMVCTVLLWDGVY